jgi:hypothetical protein
MEPISAAQLPPADLQLAATIEAWEVASRQGWVEPEPVDFQAECSVPLDDQPALIGSAWDSWSSNPYLEHQQVEELPGFAAREEY